MKKLQRYTCWPGGPEEDDNGSCCDQTEVAALESRCAALKAENVKLRDSIKALRAMMDDGGAPEGAAELLKGATNVPLSQAIKEASDE